MKKIHVYLTFNGNCREAMMFYKKCLGGKLSFQTIGDSPLVEKLPQKMKTYIVHSTLIKKNLILTASDMVSESGLIKGNAVSLILSCSNESEAKKCYNKLSVGGKKTHPLKYNNWGILYGDLIDQFGNHWILNHLKK